MRRIKTILITMTAVFSLTACGAPSNSDNQATTIQTDPQTSEESSAAVEESSTSTEESTIAVEESSAAAIESSTAAENSSTVTEAQVSYEEYLDSLQYLEAIEAKFMAANSTVDMNMAVTESSEAWDKELNKIYGLLSEKLSEAQMEELRTIQRQWITERDQRAEQHAAEFEGGTFYSVAYGDFLSRCTKSRTMELIDVYFDKSTDFSFSFDSISDGSGGE